MNRLALALVLVATSMPVAAQTSIRGIELSQRELPRVERQCNVLRFRESRSLGASTPEPPAAGESPSDPSAYWASGADEMDEALTRINLGSLSFRDCRDAGFYD